MSGAGLGGRLRNSEGEFLKVGRQGDANRLKELTSDAGGRGAQQEALANMGATQGLLLAIVADAVPTDLRGTAFGLYSLITGAALLRIVGR